MVGVLVDFVGRVRRVIRRLVHFGTPLTRSIALAWRRGRDLALEATHKDGHGIFKGHYTTSELRDLRAHAYRLRLRDSPPPRGHRLG
jgi:hypothetical protein